MRDRSGHVTAGGTSPVDEPPDAALWRLVAGDAAGRAERVWRISASADWNDCRSRLSDGEGGVILVARRPAYLVWSLLRRRWPGPFRGRAGLRRIRRVVIADHGSEVETWRVWTSNSAPRVVAPDHGRLAVRWAHRNGILVGGGRKPLLVSWMLLAPVVGRLLWWLAPQAAVVVPQKGRGG